MGVVFACLPCLKTKPLPLQELGWPRLQPGGLIMGDVSFSRAALGQEHDLGAWEGLCGVWGGE